MIVARTTNLLRPAEAARRLGMSRQALSRAMNRGRVKFVTVAGMRMLTPQAVRAYAARKDTKLGRPTRM